MGIDSDALEFHSSGRKGKIEVIPTKPCDTERDLALAYSPGVAAPCLEIAKDPTKVFDYTARGNLVAVISNGTAVLGLGNIGPLASKPVMEGKGILFKRFADIDVFDIELNCTDVDEFVATVKALEPTFGGVNLEDIKAPECFEIEERLKKECQIPIFHDDQHGTAIISGAGLLNAVELAGKKLDEIKIVMNGAGASSIACARLFVSLGVKRENITMCDSRGTIRKDRSEGMNKYKEEFANDTKAKNLEEALVGADAFVGLSVAGAVTPNMVEKMADRPIIFAMANPTPEIMPDQVKEVRPDALVATGRSDFPNQVNNLLGFPYIFRGALDVRSTGINEEMKLAAVRALAELAREEIPESVTRAYGGKHFEFGPEYMIPKPFDPRVLLKVAPAVAKAAMDSGLALTPITDFDAYRDKLESMQGASKGFVRDAINRVKRHASKNNEELPAIYFPEGTSAKVLKAVQIILEEGIARPILMGYPDVVKQSIDNLHLDGLNDVPIIHPSKHENYEKYVRHLHEMRKRKGVNLPEAQRLLRDPNYFAAMAVHLNEADAVIAGATQNYAGAVKPILEIIGRTNRGVAAGLMIMIIDKKVYLFADTTINVDPTSEDLASIAMHAADVARYFYMEPRISMLSFSNFTAKKASPRKMKEAAEIVKERYPDVLVDGEMQADTAVNPEIMEELFPFSEIKRGSNILIFPNLDAGNISYKLVQQMGKGEVLGPVLMGVRRPANVLQRSCSVNDIVNMAALTALQVQARKELHLQL